MWWDQCPAECVLCHCGIQGLVSLRRNATKEARLSTADEAKWFCKWKCNKVFAAYACTSNMFGLFCFSICLQWQTNGIQLWILHKFSVNPIKLWLVSIWGQDWSAASWSAALLGTNAVSGRPIHYSLVSATVQIWRCPPAAPPWSEPTATAFAISFFTPILPYTPDSQQQNILRQLVLVAVPLRMQTSLWKSTIKFTQVLKMFSDYFQGNKPSNHPLRHHTWQKCWLLRIWLSLLFWQWQSSDLCTLFLLAVLPHKTATGAGEGHKRKQVSPVLIICQ